MANLKFLLLACSLVMFPAVQAGEIHCAQCDSGIDASIQTNYVARLKEIDENGVECDQGTFSGNNIFRHRTGSGNWMEFSQKCKDLMGNFLQMLSHALCGRPGTRTAVDLDMKTRIINANGCPKPIQKTDCCNFPTPVPVYRQVQAHETKNHQYCEPHQHGHHQHGHHHHQHKDHESHHHQHHHHHKKHHHHHHKD